MTESLTVELLDVLSSRFGDSFYILNSWKFEQNYKELAVAFMDYYSKFNIAYSYKTNYTPKLIQMVERFGGYAEVVSDMEMELALRAGIERKHIIWNGPIKNRRKIKELLLTGGTVNIDSINEMQEILTIAEKNPECNLNVGIRVNYDVGDGVLSRFGFDINSAEFDEVLQCIKNKMNIQLMSLQAHFAKRAPEYWSARAEGLLNVYEKVKTKYGLMPERLDLGGGIYGKMPESLRLQLGVAKTTYADYAIRAARLFEEHFKNESNKPWMFIEPGTAIVGDCMQFVCKIETIKTIRGKTIITVCGSQKNINMNGINPPMTVIGGGEQQQFVEDADIVGYTCIEGDVLQKAYNGSLAVGDYVIFDNCGSYSLVMKPPFIFPNCAVLDIDGDEVEVIKKAETFDDLFHTFHF